MFEPMKLKRIILFGVLYLVGLLLSTNMNCKYKIFTYKSAMWADASGYYVYLPATFIYDWKAETMPKRMDTLTGLGFYYRDSGKMLFTKYTNGQCYLHLPFFLIAHAYCLMGGDVPDGFSQPYVDSLIWAGIFYLLAGFFLLYFVLKKYASAKASVITLVALFMCTNLYYYTIKHPGLSHVYTFFLVAFLLYLVQYFTPRKVLLILPVAALIVLIRPTNLTLPTMALLFGMAIHGKGFLKQVPKAYFFFGAILGFLIFIPQLLYWHTLTGHWFMYSYENEGFIYWNSPKILQVLFAPNNGYFMYAPILVFAMIGLKYKPVSMQFTLATLALFILITYIHGSWHSPGFGCAYGARAYIDFMPIFAFGLAAFIQAILNKTKPIQLLSLIVILGFAFFNLKYIYGYDDCWHTGTWNYKGILNVLSGQLPQ
jgi:hypothetical protein